jgi:hypothetical protein
LEKKEEFKEGEEDIEGDVEEKEEEEKEEQEEEKGNDDDEEDDDEDDEEDDEDDDDSFASWTYFSSSKEFDVDAGNKKVEGWVGGVGVTG